MVTIDCNHSGRAFAFNSTINAALVGFTVRNGRSAMLEGGGAVWVGLATNISISDCTFISNSADYGGGAIALQDTLSASLSRCVFG